jgi:hypothetical protein
MIKEQEAGMPTAEVCRMHGLSPASFYKFKAKYGGMNVGAAPSWITCLERPFGCASKTVVFEAL